MLKKWPELGALVVTGLVGTVFFSLTNPKTVAPAFFIAGFVILMAALYSLLRLVGRLTGLRGRLRPLTYRSFLAGATLLPVMLLALQSIGQLTLRDVLILLIFFAGAYFYVSRLRLGQ